MHVKLLPSLCCDVQLTDRISNIANRELHTQRFCRRSHFQDPHGDGPGGLPNRNWCSNVTRLNSRKYRGSVGSFSSLWRSLNSDCQQSVSTGIALIQACAGYPDWYAPLNNSLPLYLMPIYIRAGAILPMRELEQYVGQLAQNPTTFNIYAGPDSSFQLYQDDGISNDYQAGVFRTTTIRHQEIPKGPRVRVQRSHDQYAPPEPFFFVSFLGTSIPTSAKAAGASLPNVLTPAALASATANAYYYNQSLKTTFVKIFDVATDLTLEVTF